LQNSQPAAGVMIKGSWSRGSWPLRAIRSDRDLRLALSARSCQRVIRLRRPVLVEDSDYVGSEGGPRLGWDAWIVPVMGVAQRALPVWLMLGFGLREPTCAARAPRAGSTFVDLRCAGRSGAYCPSMTRPGSRAQIGRPAWILTCRST
jgi:hypothetical protein